MQVASLLVRALREHIPHLRTALELIPGVQVHDEDVENACLIVTVEDGQGYAVSDSILAVNMAEHVHSATLVYEYTDQNLELTGA